MVASYPTYPTHTSCGFIYFTSEQVLEQLESMHGSLRERLEASESSIQRNISFGGHLDFLCDLVGSYGAR